MILALITRSHIWTVVSIENGRMYFSAQSVRFPNYIKATQPVLEIFKMTRYILARPYIVYTGIKHFDHDIH